jgi:hypothetical protein
LLHRNRTQICDYDALKISSGIEVKSGQILATMARFDLAKVSNQILMTVSSAVYTMGLL